MSDTNESGDFLKDTENNPMGQQGLSFMFFKRYSEKIATATHLVTNVLDDREPLKWSLRQSVLELVFETGIFFSDNALNRDVLESVRGCVDDTRSLLNVGVASNLISEMNGGILKGELKKFADEVFMYVGRKETISPYSLKAVLADIPEHAPLALEDRNPKDIKIFKGHIKKEQKPIGQVRIVVKGQNNNISKGQQISSASGKERKDKVLSIIKEKGAATIKDIATTVPEYSEKTIQRDLADLVVGGVVKKRGERRWTVYFM